MFPRGFSVVLWWGDAAAVSTTLWQKYLVAYIRINSEAKQRSLKYVKKNCSMRISNDTNIQKEQCIHVSLSRYVAGRLFRRALFNALSVSARKLRSGTMAYPIGES
jgi:hypothetical protein